MRELGAGTITGKFGPSICGTCYEVDQNTFDEVTAAFHPESGSFKTAQGTPAR